MKKLTVFPQHFKVCNFTDNWIIIFPENLTLIISLFYYRQLNNAQSTKSLKSSYLYTFYLGTSNNSYTTPFVLLPSNLTYDVLYGKTKISINYKNHSLNLTTQWPIEISIRSIFLAMNIIMLFVGSFCGFLFHVR